MAKKVTKNRKQAEQAAAKRRHLRIVAGIIMVAAAAGLACGHLVLTVAVLAILITAPLGAFGIDLLYRRCLSQEKNAAEQKSAASMENS